MNIPVFTYAIIGLTVIVSIVGFTNQRILGKNLFSIRSIIRDREIYRLLTSQLFHVNWVHLIFNMLSFYSFGISMERAFGPGLPAAIYLSSALCGDMVALLVRRKDPNYSAVGASGAVCGIIFASIFLLPGGSIFAAPWPLSEQHCRILSSSPRLLTAVWREPNLTALTWHSLRACFRASPCQPGSKPA